MNRGGATGLRTSCTVTGTPLLRMAGKRITRLPVGSSMGASGSIASTAGRLCSVTAERSRADAWADAVVQRTDKHARPAKIRADHDVTGTKANVRITGSMLISVSDGPQEPVR